MAQNNSAFIWAWLQSGQTEFTISWQRHGGKFRQKINVETWSSHDRFMTTALNQCERSCPAWSLVAILALAPVAEYQDTFPLSDTDECQYRFWVHECFCKRGGLRVFEIKHVYPLAQPISGEESYAQTCRHRTLFSNGGINIQPVMTIGTLCFFTQQ